MLLREACRSTVSRITAARATVHALSSFPSAGFAKAAAAPAPAASSSAASAPAAAAAGSGPAELFNVFQQSPMSKLAETATSLRFPLPNITEPTEWKFPFRVVSEGDLWVNGATLLLDPKIESVTRDRFKAKVSVKVSDMKLQPLEREIFLTMAGSRYNKKKDTCSFVSRELGSMTVCISLLEEIGKSISSLNVFYLGLIFNC